MFPINNNTLVHVASNISTAVRAHQQERSRRADPLNDRWAWKSLGGAVLNVQTLREIHATSHIATYRVNLKNRLAVSHFRAERRVAEFCTILAQVDGGRRDRESERDSGIFNERVPARARPHGSL